jgi:protein gp37
MGTFTKIEWTDHTFNPWVGCTKVSDGCKHCYAEALSKRTELAVWGDQGTRKHTSNAYWKQPYSWAKKARQAGGPKPRVFCASLADVLEDRPDVALWRADLWSIIRDTADALDWLLLTKRPENFPGMIPDDVMRLIWFGVSCENQRAANERITWLLEAQPAVRFISAEPLLSGIDFTEACDVAITVNGVSEVPAVSGWGNWIDWVIVGGESGPGARPMSEHWAQSIRNQCVAAGVPFFFKQWGEYGYFDQVPEDTYQEIDAAGELPTDNPLRLGKKRAGALLDGREWRQFPEERD